MKAESRPSAKGTASQETNYFGNTILTAVTDAWQAEEPAFVVRVQVNDLGGSRVFVFRTLAAAESAVERATKRGRDSRITLCALLPVGVS